MKVNHLIFLIVLICTCTFVSCKKKSIEYYVGLQSELLSQFSQQERVIFSEENKSVILVSIDELPYKNRENILACVRTEEIFSNQTKSAWKNNSFENIYENRFFNEKPEIIKVKDVENLVSNQKKNKNTSFEQPVEYSMVIQTEYLYPCVAFDENLPSVAAIDDIVNGKIKPVLVVKFDDIPSGYVALPLSKEIQNEKWKGINAVYPGNKFYPFYSETKMTIYLPSLKKNDFLEKQHFVKEWFYNSLYPKCKVDSKAPPIVFISATGDIMIARGVEDKLIASASPAPVFNDTLQVLQNNDFTIGNLEGVVTTKTTQAIKTYTFKFRKSALSQLKNAGYDYFMLTNNHSYDYGEGGFKDTLAALKEYDFKTSGAGYNKNEASEVYVQNIKGTNIAVLSVGAYPVENSGFNGEKTASATDKRAGILWKSDEVYNIVKTAKENGSFVIVNAHAGTEYSTKPSSVQRDFYEKLCDSGADVIFGSHPHVLQPVEWYNNSLIVWSLGNFVFPGMELMPGAEDTMIIRTGIVNGRLLYYQKYPAKITGKTVSLK